MDPNLNEWCNYEVSQDWDGSLASYPTGSVWVENTGTTSTPSMTLDNPNTETLSEDTDDGCLSPAPSVYSLTSSLRNQSFRYAHGRTLNAHSDVYSLPADDEEAHRLYWQRKIFWLMSHDHYYGMYDVVKDILTPSRERQRKVLDLGCGPGAWSIQCATDFPHADVLGVDLAPTTVVTPPDNCRFEIDDLNLGLEHFHGPTFDLVHARLLNSGIKDYAGLLDEVSRCLRPGGLAIFAEFDFRIWSEDKRLLIPPNFYTPLPTQGKPSLGATSSSSRANVASNKVPTTLTEWAVPTWMATMSKCIRAKGGDIDAAMLLKTWMKEHRNYEGAHEADFWAPIGPWKATKPDAWTMHPNFYEAGEMTRDNLIYLMRGARPLLYEWFSEDEVAQLENAAIYEAQAATNPMYIRVRVSSAFKKA